MLNFSTFSGFLTLVSAYRWPLANYTGGAEVDHGYGVGKVGCTVTTGPKPPYVPYYGMYFDQGVSSYVETRMGTETILTDWAFVMFIYPNDLSGGTLFHYMYDGPTVLSPTYADEIRLWLDSDNIMLTIRGPSGEDYGTIVAQHDFNVGGRHFVSVSHEYSDGRIVIRTLAEILYNSASAQDNVYIHQPAKIKIGGSYGDQALPFKGSIVCLTTYDHEPTYDEIKLALYGCDPGSWNVVPQNINLPRASCPENLGYFIVVSKDYIPYSTFVPVYTTHALTPRQCSATCLQDVQCQSFAFEKTSETCMIYSNVFGTNLEMRSGYMYYRRRDICC